MSKRHSLAQRIANRNAQNVRNGRPPGWADEALDLYLEGFEVREIMKCYNLQYNPVFYNSIAKAALYRLMAERAAERLDDMTELTNGHGHGC
jgi:hypothetical protein